MGIEQRLTKVEHSISLLATTLLWLEEAHAFGSLPAYVAWLIDQPLAAAPLVRVAEAAEASVARSMPGTSREARRSATRAAVREAVFGVELVIGLNRAEEELLRSGGLRYVVLHWQMRAIGAEARVEEAAGPEPWRAWQVAVADLLTDLYAAEEARKRLEARFVGGHSALFPEAIAAWQNLRDGVEAFVELAAAVVQAPDPRARSKKPILNLAALRRAARGRVQAVMAEVVDGARAVTLDVLGDTEGATSIVARRLRATLSDDGGPG
jgi:hypothetical protein